MHLTRRKLLIAGGIGVAVIGAAGLGVAVRLSRTPEADFIKAIVRHELSYLRYSEATLDKFAADFLVKDRTLTSYPSKYAVMIGPDVSRLIAQNTTHFENLPPLYERVASQFLLSTDFFQNGRNMERVLDYVAFADPYLNACGNPLVRLG